VPSPREKREGGRTELIIRAQDSMKFSTISQDDEHLSWGRIKKEKEERVGGEKMHMTEHGEGLRQTYCPHSLLESRML
jgi:hypothetical protein